MQGASVGLLEKHVWFRARLHDLCRSRTPAANLKFKTRPLLKMLVNDVYAVCDSMC